MNPRRLWTLLVREARTTWRDPFTMTILVTVPLAALLVFSFVLSTEVEKLPLGVSDASGTTSSRRLVAELAAKGTFAPRSFTTRGSLDRALVVGEISAAIVIPPDFERRLREASAGGAPAELQVLYDGGETVLAGNSEAFLRSLALSTVAELSSGARAQAMGSPVALPRLSPPDVGTPASTGVSVVSRALFNPKLEGSRGRFYGCVPIYGDLSPLPSPKQLTAHKDRILGWVVPLNFACGTQRVHHEVVVSTRPETE